MAQAASWPAAGPSVRVACLPTGIHALSAVQVHLQSASLHTGAVSPRHSVCFLSFFFFSNSNMSLPSGEGARVNDRDFEL